MRVEVIVTEDGVMLPQGNELFRIVNDAEVGPTLRAMAGGATEKPKRKRGKNKPRQALGKTTEVTG